MNERAFIALGSVNLLNMIFKPRVVTPLISIAVACYCLYDTFCEIKEKGGES